jgi:hypothetical protein
VIVGHGKYPSSDDLLDASVAQPGTPLLNGVAPEYYITLLESLGLHHIENITVLSCSIGLDLATRIAQSLLPHTTAPGITACGVSERWSLDFFPRKQLSLAEGFMYAQRNGTPPIFTPRNTLPVASVLRTVFLEKKPDA